MKENPKLIKDIDAVQRFRDILFYQRKISNSLIFILYPVRILLIYIFNDGLIDIKIMLIIIAVAAVLFTPYIFYVLIKENKYGWIFTFFALTVFPLLFAYFVFKDALFFEAIILLPLGSFYIYCFWIKFEVDKWLNDYSWHQTLLEQKRETEDRIKNEMIM